MAEGKGFDISAIIRLDGEQKFKQAVTTINSSIRAMNADMRKLKEEYAGNENSLDALQKKQKIYTSILQAQNEKIAATERGLKNAQNMQNDFAESINKTKIALSDAEKELNTMQKTSGTSAAAIKAQQAEVDRLTSALKKGDENYAKLEGRVASWNAKLSNAQAELEKTKNKQKENNKYVDEASQSIDKCANSIDGYGKKVKVSTEATIKWGEAFKAGAMGKVADAGVAALESLGSATIGAAKDLEQAGNQIQASTGLTGEALEQYKDVLEDVYANNYGDNLEDVSQSISKITHNMGELDNATLQNVTESAITLRDTFDMELDETLRGAKTLMYQFGMTADDAFDLLGSGAQAGLNYTDELGDNISEYGGNFAQAGYSAKEYFQLLKNGSDNGAYNLDKVNDAINEVTNKLADGSVEKSLSIYSTNTQNLFKQWQNGEATQKQVIDSIVSDINNCTNQQDALTMSATAFGTMGEDSNLKFVQSLTSVGDNFTDVQGKMEEIKNVKYDDLNSQIAEIGRNIEMKVGVQLEKLLPVVKSGLELVEEHLDLVIGGIAGLGTAIGLSKLFKAGFFTTAIKGLASVAGAFKMATVEAKLLNLTTAATPWGAIAVAIGIATAAVVAFAASEEKTTNKSRQFLDEAEKMADATEDLADQMEKSKEAYEENQTSIESQYGALQIMSDRLYELAEAETLSNSQKAEMNAYIDQLNEAMPELNLALDEHTGKLNTDKEATDSYIESLKQKAIMEESEKRINGIIQEQAEAHLNAAEAIVKKKAAEDERARLKEEWNKIEDESITKTGVEIEQQAKLDKQIAECDESIKSYSETIEENNKKSGECDVRVKEVTDSLGELERQTGSTAETTDSMTAAVSQMSEEQAEAIDAIKAKYEELRSSIEQNIESSISAYEKFNGGTKITSDEVIKNLDSQIEGLTNWRDNMIILADAAGNGMSKEFLDYLTKLGPEGANLVQTLVKSLKDQDGDFEGICKRWMKVLNIKEVTKEELSEATAGLTSSITKMGEAAESGGKTVYGAFRDALTGTADLATQSGGKTTDAFVLSFQDLVSAAGNYGIQIPESLAGGIADGSIQPEQAMAEVDALIQEKAATLSVIMGELGIDMTSEMQSGIESGGTNTIEAVQSMNQAITEKQEEMSAKAGKKGEEVSKKTAEGIGSGSEAVSEAARIVMSGAASAGQGYVIQFPPIGYNMMSGVASGLNSGSALVYDKVREILNQAKREAEKINDQHSPSKVWRNKVGLMMSQGMALGIKDGQKDVITQSVELARAALKGAQDELEIRSPSGVFKKKVGRQIGKGVAFGIKDSTKAAQDEAKALSSKILKASTSWMERYKKANKSRRKDTLQNLENEKYYWEQVRKYLKKGTDAYNAATKKISAAKKKISEKEKAIKQKEIAEEKKDYGVSGSGLDMYKTYYNVSAKAEKDYWDTVRKSKGLSAAQKLEADKNYYDAVENLNDQLKDLNQDYEDNVKETNESMIESINEVTEAYADAVAERKESILSSFGLFDEFYSESESGEKLLYNLRSQVAGIADWEKELEELQSRGNLSDAVMDELKEMGPAASASIHALNSLTDEQLKEYNSLYVKRDELAASQAAKDTERQRAESEAKIQQIKANAQKELDAYKAEYDKAYGELTKSMEAPLKQLAKNATTLGETATLNLVRGFGNKASQKSTKEEVKKGGEKITDGLNGLPKEGKKIGKNTLQGILDGLMDGKKIKGGAKDFIQDLTQAIKKEAGIRSPSRLFKQEVGVQISAGVGEGIADGTPKAAKAGTDMIAAMLEQSKQRVAQQQAALSEYAASLNTGAGIVAFNKLVQMPPVPSTTVTVNNTEVAGMISQMAVFMQEMREDMRNLKVVLDTGTLVGEISPNVGNNLAAITRRLR